MDLEYALTRLELLNVSPTDTALQLKDLERRMSEISSAVSVSNPTVHTRVCPASWLTRCGVASVGFEGRAGNCSACAGGTERTAHAPQPRAGARC